ncbi:MAG: PfkB family carbohydrate kinase [Candidatus Velamenicoccus archaeovorus]
MTARTIRLPSGAPFRRLVGVGGIGTGMFLAVEGDRTIGRSESRAGRLLDIRDYCKLHTVSHHVATLLGARPSGDPFHVVPVGAVGSDEAGSRLVAEMAAAGMDVGHVRTAAGMPTLFSVCFQYPDGAGGNITTVDSAAATLSAADVEGAAELLDPGTIALAQPEVPIEQRRRFLQVAGDRNALRVASFVSLELDEARSTGLFDLVDLVSLNEHEAATVAGADLHPSDPAPFLRRCAAAFGGSAGSSARGVRVVVTVGDAGAYAIEGHRWGYRPAPKVEVVSTAGCGDALLAGVLIALAAGVPFLGDARHPRIDDAVGFGVVLASLNATSPHTIHPEADVSAVLELGRRCDLMFVGALGHALGGVDG